jgi:putative ABC transport system permease protein
MSDEPRTPEWKPLLRHPPKGDAIEADARAEMEAHVELAVEHLVARGIPREQALIQARARFGEYTAATVALAASANAREQQVGRREYRHELAQDVRLALRHFRRAPMFFGAAILTLAIGIGANGAVFSILRASLLQELPYRNPQELAMVWSGWDTEPVSRRGGLTPAARGINVAPMLTAWRRDFADVGEIAGVFSGANNTEARYDIALSDGTERLEGAAVTPNFFQMLGVTPVIGRVFSEADVGSGTPLVVLSHATWERVFGSDPTVVGRPVTLTYGRRDRVPHTLIVAGVLPREFRFSYPSEVQLWTMRPWSVLDADNPNAIQYQAVIRLAPGVTMPQAQERLDVLSKRMYEGYTFPQGQRLVLRLEPIHEWVVGQVRPAMYLIGGVAALLLLITCATVANGLLVRASARAQEVAVRVAIGASRWRLIRQLLTEGIVLSLAGAVAGTLLAVALQPILRALIPASVPLVGDIALSGWTIAFGVAMAGVATVLAALAPAWSGTNVDASAALTRSATASSPRSAVRSRQMLVGAQAAVAATLLVSATLLLTSLFKLGRVPLGFDGTDVLTVEMRLLGTTKYADDAARGRLQDEVVERVRAIPGVVEAGMTTAVPFRGTDYTLNVKGFEPGAGFKAKLRTVDSAYFGVLQIPLVRGRLFDASDRRGSERVVVVSEAFARNAFGTQDPLGLSFDWDGPSRVVGVVRDVRYKSINEEAVPAVYFARTQEPSDLMCLVVRTSGDVASVAPAIRRIVRDIDPTIPVMRLTTVDRIVSESIADRRFYTMATAMFASIALLLTVVGLVVVVSRAVTERKRELAIRAALGATVRHLVNVATRDALIAVAVGLAIGLGVAYRTSALLQQFLFEIAPQSPLSFVSVATLLLGVSAAAAWAAARRVSRLPLARVIAAD